MGTTTTNYGFYKPDGSEFVDVMAQINANLDDIDATMAALDDFPTGKLWRTAGFTGALPAVGAAITFDASRLVFGMAASGSGDSLIVPSAGMYDVRLNGYASGGGAAAVVQFTAVRVRAATPDKVVCLLSLSKINANDLGGSFTDNVPLAAGDEIKVIGSSSDSAVNGWGIDEVSGIRLSVEYTGPLNGATPV